MKEQQAQRLVLDVVDLTEAVGLLEQHGVAKSAVLRARNTAMDAIVGALTSPEVYGAASYPPVDARRVLVWRTGALQWEQWSTSAPIPDDATHWRRFPSGPSTP